MVNNMGAIIYGILIGVVTGIFLGWLGGIMLMWFFSIFMDPVPSRVLLWNGLTWVCLAFS